MDPNVLTRDLEEFYKLHPTMQLSTLLVFLFIAQRGTTNQKDIEKALGMTNGAASRNVAYWTTRRADRTEGPGYVESVPDDYDRRFNIIRLTDKGRKFYEELRDRSNAKASRSKVAG